jgi:hypothetical protein
VLTLLPDVTKQIESSVVIPVKLFLSNWFLNSYAMPSTDLSLPLIVSSMHFHILSLTLKTFNVVCGDGAVFIGCFYYADIFSIHNYLCSIQVMVPAATALLVGLAMAKVSVSLTVPRLPLPS